MKCLAVVFALVAVAYADVSELGYKYQQPAQAAPMQCFIPAPQQTYIPPVAPAPAPVYQPAATYQPAPIYQQPQADVGYSYNPPDNNQGYRYKTVRRVIYRQRF